MTIVKVQVPLSSNTAPALVYAKGHKGMQTVHLSPDLKKALGDRPRRYFEARMENGRWLLLRPTTDQDW